MTTLSILAYIIDIYWESVQSDKIYHTRLDVGNDLSKATDLFKQLAWNARPVREQAEDRADGGMMLFGVTSWNRGEGDGPVMVKLDSHEWTHA